MFKIISKKEYETMFEIINKQNEQIDELIVLAADARAKAKHATKCYCDLVEMIDENLQSLPCKAIETIREIRKLMGNEG